MFEMLDTVIAKKKGDSVSRVPHDASMENGNRGIAVKAAISYIVLDALNAVQVISTLGESTPNDKWGGGGVRQLRLDPGIPAW